MPLALERGAQEHLGTLDWLLRRCWPAARLVGDEAGAEVFSTLSAAYVAFGETIPEDDKARRPLVELALLALQAVELKMRGDDAEATKAAGAFDRAVPGFELAAFVAALP